MSSFPILFRTDDPLKWGDGKGAPLNAPEVDENFWVLLQMILALESNPAQPAEIVDISVSGNTMTIELSNGSEFGPFVLPTAGFRWRDGWTPATEYLKNDIFTANRSAYLVLHDHTSAGSFDPEASDLVGTVYQLMFEYPVDFDIGFFFPGLPGTGIEIDRPMFSYKTARAFYLLADLPGSVAGLIDAPTEELVFIILQNETEIGTLTFAASSVVGTFAFAATTQFVAGDVLKVLTPDTVDATAADLSVTFAGVKGTFEAPSSS